MKKQFSFFLLFIAVLHSVTWAQQFKWTKNNGAAATLNSYVFASANSNNETWVIPPSSSSTRFFGAGNGVAPDLGIIETTGGFIQRFDGNMNLVWSAPNAGGSIVVADLQDPTRFYVAGTFTASSGTFMGAQITGQVAASAAFVAHCQALGTNSATALWVAKVDGLQDETVNNLVVKNIGGGHIRVVVEGTSRSASVTNYSNGTTAAMQTVPLPGTGNVYNTYINCLDETIVGSTATVIPIWINTFGSELVPYSRPFPICMNDNGDVILAAAYNSNTVGTVSYTLRNCSGANPGSVTETGFTANITTSRYLLLSLLAANGSIAAMKNELGNANCNIDPRGITTDAAGNVFMHSTLRGTYAPGGTSNSITSAGSGDLSIIVFDNALTPLRAQRYGNSGENNIQGYISSFALDRTNNRLYMIGTTNTNFTAGVATIQALSGYDGFILAANATGTMEGLSAVSCNGTGVANSADYIGSVLVRPDGNVIGFQHYTMAGHNRLNGSTTPLLLKTAYGYQDVAITKFDGNATSLLNPLAEGGFGGTTSNVISASALKGSELLSAGTFSGAMTIGSNTLSGSGVMLVLTDTATGNINNVYTLQASSIIVSDIKVSPVNGAIYVCGTTGGSITLSTGTVINKLVAGKYDAFVMKFDASFNHLWTAYVGGAENEYGRGLTLDPVTGDVYISGQFFSDYIRLSPAGATTFNSTNIATNSNTSLPISADVFVAKFNSAGTFQWSSSGGSASTTVNDNAVRTLLYLNGNVYVGLHAVTNNSISFGGQSVTTSSGSGTIDMVLAQLKASNGTASWIKTWAGGRGEDYIQSLATYNNLIYLGGYSSNNISSFLLGGLPFTTAGSWDGFIFATDENGTDQTGFVKVGGNGNDYVYEIKADAVGNLFFAGQSSSSSLPIAGSTLGTIGSNDCLVGIADANSMTLKFGFMTGSSQDEGFNTVTPGLLGMAFTGGNIKGAATFGSTVINGRLGGDFLFTRIDYPYIGPGAQVSNLNTWFKTNAQLNGNPAINWSNSSTNSILDMLSSTGTVPVSATGLNYNPTFDVSGTTAYLGINNIYPSNFLDASGSKFSIYTVFKPTASTDQLQLWSESVTGTGISLGASGNTITGTGGSKTATHTTALSTGQYSISSLLVNGTAMSNYVNGTANGTQTGVSALSTTNAGTFRTAGTGNMSIAEIMTYGGAHTAANPPINRIETYLAIKYGITLKHHYYNTVGDTLYKYNGAYLNNIAGIGRDDNELLLQKQSISQNTNAKGNMLAIGLGALASSNAENTGTFSQDRSYLIWGDDGGSVTTLVSTNIPTGYSSCAYRLQRSWKINRSGNGTGATQVKMDMNGTAASGTLATDFWLVIDADGDGNFATGAITKVQATNLSAGLVTFNNVTWDADANGSDVFTLVTDLTSNMPAPSLTTTATSAITPQHTCTDASGYLQFVDVLPSPSKKFVAIHPKGNSGYNFSVRCSNDSASYIANQMKTDGVANTTALMNRMYTIADAGTNNYTVNGGMTVRLYYTAADSIAAMAALDPAIVTGVSSFAWFKVSGNNTLGTAASAKLAKESQTATGISPLPQYGAALLVPARYGTEAGVRYVEFDGVKNFSTFGAVAKRGAFVILPIKFTYNSLTVNNCSVKLDWRFATNSAVSSQVFEIERSSNSTNFQTVGKVTAAQILSFHDNPPYAGTWYYRIKATELSGSTTYSSVMVARTAVCEAITLNIYPNPADKNLNIQIEAVRPITYHYEITDALGRKVMQRNVQQANIEKIDVSNLLPGVYVVNVFMADKTISKKLLVNHLQ